jgi:hypothetical protein
MPQMLIDITKYDKPTSTTPPQVHNDNQHKRACIPPQPQANHPKPSKNKVQPTMITRQTTKSNKK